MYYYLLYSVSDKLLSFGTAAGDNVITFSDETSAFRILLPQPGFILAADSQLYHEAYVSVQETYTVISVDPNMSIV